MNFAIGIIGLALAIWGIILTIKNSKYPGEITFIREQTISLFEDIVKNIPDLIVLYKDNPIPSNIVLIKGALINTGKKDISPSMVESPINITVPEKFKWISIQSVSASENVHGNLSILDGKSLELKMGLLRCNEYIRFQALLQVPLDEIIKENKGFRKIPDEDIIWNYINFDHRIEGTRCIKKINAENVQYNKIIEKESLSIVV